MLISSYYFIVRLYVYLCHIYQRSPRNIYEHFTKYIIKLLKCIHRTSKRVGISIIIEFYHCVNVLQSSMLLFYNLILHLVRLKYVLDNYLKHLTETSKSKRYFDLHDYNMDLVLYAFSYYLFATRTALSVTIYENSKWEFLRIFSIFDSNIEYFHVENFRTLCRCTAITYWLCGAKSKAPI